jgi:integrase
MGRYPFLERVDEYLQAIRRPSELTFRERSGKLKMLGHVYNRLLDRNANLVADPKKFGEREIFALLDWMRDANQHGGRMFSVAYQVKLVQHVRLMLRYFGNPVLDNLKAKGVELPKVGRKKLHAPNHAEVQGILQQLESVEGWHGASMRFAVAFHYATGVRVKELRLASLKDLDPRTMRFTIQHPKGEGAWADAGRQVKLPKTLSVAIQDFIDARSCFLAEVDLDPAKVQALIPTRLGRFHTDGGWRSLRVKVFKQAGITANFRELRPAHAMRLKKLGVPIEAVSQRLGHSDTRTTEAYYARTQDEDAEDLALKAWESADRPVIDS